MLSVLLTLAFLPEMNADVIGGCPWDVGSELNTMLTENGVSADGSVCSGESSSNGVCYFNVPDEAAHDACSTTYPGSVPFSYETEYYCMIDAGISSLTDCENIFPGFDPVSGGDYYDSGLPELIAECQLSKCNDFPSDPTQCDDVIFQTDGDNLRIYSYGDMLKVYQNDVEVLLIKDVTSVATCDTLGCVTVTADAGKTIPSQSDLRAACAASCAAISVEGTGCLDEESAFSSTCDVTVSLDNVGDDHSDLSGHEEGGICSVLWPDKYPNNNYEPQGQQYLIRSSKTNQCMHTEYTQDCFESNPSIWYEVREVTEGVVALISYETGYAVAIDEHSAQSDCRMNLYQRDGFASEQSQLWEIEQGSSGGHLLKSTWGGTVYLTDKEEGSQIYSCPDAMLATDVAASAGEWFFTPVGGTCFRNTDTVKVRSGVFRTTSEKPLSEVKVGDHVQTGPSTYTEVTGLPHSKSTSPFIEVRMAGPERHALAATEHHTFPTCNHRSHTGRMVRAYEIKPGDCLHTVDGERTVASVERRLVAEGDETYTVELKGNHDVLLVGGVVTHAKPQTAKAMLDADAKNMVGAKNSPAQHKKLKASKKKKTVKA
jgi:hypothetical protein